MGRPSRTLFEIAEDLLIKSIPNGECTDCHLFAGDTGYCNTSYGGAHRVVWEGLFNPLNGLWVLHSCDNRRCINPAHLFTGTCQDNVTDMITKGRKVIPEQFRAISDEQRKEINELHKQGYGPKFLAEYFGVSRSTIKRNLGETYDPYR